MFALHAWCCLFFCNSHSQIMAVLLPFWCVPICWAALHASALTVYIAVQLCCWITGVWWLITRIVELLEDWCQVCRSRCKHCSSRQLCSHKSCPWHIFWWAWDCSGCKSNLSTLKALPAKLLCIQCTAFRHSEQIVVHAWSQQGEGLLGGILLWSNSRCKRGIADTFSTFSLLLESCHLMLVGAWCVIYTVRNLYCKSQLCGWYTRRWNMWTARSTCTHVLPSFHT